MLKKLTIKSKLLLMEVVPIIVLIILAIVFSANLNYFYSEMKTTIYDEGYTSVSLILNADRDLYQALSSYQELIKGNLSQSERNALVSDFKENWQQVIDRVNSADECLSADSELWYTYTAKSSDNNLKQILNLFCTEFNSWATLADNTISSNTVIDNFTSSESYAELQEIRTYLDEAQNIIETTMKSQTDLMGNKKTETITTFTAIIIITISLLIIVCTFCIVSIIRPIKKITAVIKKLSAGDLTEKISLDTKDEIKHMADFINDFIDELKKIITDINYSALQVAEGSKNVSITSGNLSQGSTEQASSIEQLSSSVEELNSRTKQNADDAKEVNSLAENTKEKAFLSNEQMNALQTAMGDIRKSSKEINNIIKVIDDISFQTNILALNAAIEAARAGKYGMGFAVVAEEVRNLAARSADAAKETSELIEKSDNKIDTGISAVNETERKLKYIIEEIAKVTKLINSIMLSSGEQANSISQVNTALSQVSQVIQNNTATAEEGAAASQELTEQSDLLKKLVLHFKIN